MSIEVGLCAISEVTVDGSGTPTIIFTITADGTPLDLNNLPAGYSRYPGFLLAWAEAQDGITEPTDYNNLGSGGYVHHGVGSSVTDGQWHTFTRDLQNDLTEAQPGNTILEVHGFLIRGSGMVDDINMQ